KNHQPGSDRADQGPKGIYAPPAAPGHSGGAGRTDPREGGSGGPGATAEGSRVARRGAQGGRARAGPPGASAQRRAGLSTDPNLSRLYHRAPVAQEDRGYARLGSRPPGPG